VPKLINTDRGLAKLLEKQFGAVFLPHMVEQRRITNQININIFVDRICRVLL